MIKVLITNEKWEMYQYGYGKYRPVGKPSVSMVVTEFDTRKEAEASVKLINEKKRPQSENVMAEIISPEGSSRPAEKKKESNDDWNDWDNGGGFDVAGK